VLRARLGADRRRLGPVESARRIGDAVQTVLKVYAHEFDVARRSRDRRRRLEAREASRMATYTPPHTAPSRDATIAEPTDLRAIRDGA
jgi:hypothetical protein